MHCCFAHTTDARLKFRSLAGTVEVRTALALHLTLGQPRGVYQILTHFMRLRFPLCALLPSHCDARLEYKVLQPRVVLQTAPGDHERVVAVVMHPDNALKETGKRNKRAVATSGHFPFRKRTSMSNLPADGFTFVDEQESFCQVWLSRRMQRLHIVIASSLVCQPPSSSCCEFTSQRPLVC